MSQKIELYRPSNGSAGEAFFAAWCERCARDKAMSEGKPLEECDDTQKCELIARSMCYDTTDSRYPQEWRYENGHPVCKAFVPVGQPIPPERDDKTLDMFGGEL